MQNKNELLSNQLTSFREKINEIDDIKQEKINLRKDKNKSKSSQKSIHIAPAHEKKKSIDSNISKNTIFQMRAKNPKNEVKTNFNFENSTDRNTSKNSNINLKVTKKESFHNIKDEINYIVGSDYVTSNNNSNSNRKVETIKNNINPKTNIRGNDNTISYAINKINTANNFIYEAKKTKNGSIEENNEKNIRIKNINTNPEQLDIAIFNNIGIVPKSPLKRLQDKVTEKDKELVDLEQKLKQANNKAIINEKNYLKAEKKVESMQKIISEILSKSKADQNTIEKLKVDVFKLSNGEGENKINSNNNFINNLDLNIKNDEIIIHKIYSNFNETINCNSNNNLFYFVLISDINQEKYFWINLTKVINHKDYKEKNFSISNNDDCKLILEALAYFEKLVRKYKNVINIQNKENKSNNQTLSNKSKKTVRKLDDIKNEKYKNFTASNLPIQNLFTLEQDIINVYSDYLNFEREFNNSKNFFIDEINQKDNIIQKLKGDLEKLIDNNTKIIKNTELINNESDEKDKKISSMLNLIKEKDDALFILNSEITKLKEHSEINKQIDIHKRISELEEINFDKVKEINIFKREIEKITLDKQDNQKLYSEINKKYEEARKNINEKDELIEKFTNKLDELEKKYKNNFSKLEYFEKNELLANNFSTEEKNLLEGKIHELELIKNSHLDKISILEYINKNFENEKIEKEKLLEDVTLKIIELNHKIELLHNENKILLDGKDSFEKINIEKKNEIIRKDNEIKKLNSSLNNLEEKNKFYQEEISKLTAMVEMNSKIILTNENDMKGIKEEFNNVKVLADEKCQSLINSNKKIADLESQIRFNFEKFDEEKSLLQTEMNNSINSILAQKTGIVNKYQSLIIECNQIQRNNENHIKNSEAIIKNLKDEIKNLNKIINQNMQKFELENKELEELLIEFNSQVENSAKLQRDYNGAIEKAKTMESALLIQEEIINRLTAEKNEALSNLDNVKLKNINKEKQTNENNKNHENEIINSLNLRILEIQKINIQIDKELKLKENQIHDLKKEKDLLQKKINELKEINDKNFNNINEKNKKIIADDFTIKDLTRKLKDTEEDLKIVEDENLVFKNKIESLQKNLNFLSENKNENTKFSKEQQEKLIIKLESEIEYLNKQNNLLKEDLENSRNQCERLIEEVNENYILKMCPSTNKRGDEINITLFNNNNNTNLNNSSHLNNSNSIYDLNNTKDNNNNNINILMSSYGNKNYMTLNNNNKSNKEKEIENEYMLKINDYEDKLEKLIFSNSELQRKNNSLNIEIKTLQEKIYSLENFEEPEINKKLKQFKMQDNSNNCISKDSKSLLIENQRLQELNKDYEMSISQLQNKLEIQYNEIIRLREEYEEEQITSRKKEAAENFSFFGNEKTERNNLTFFDSNENEMRQSNLRFNNEEKFKKFNNEINEKNNLIDKLTKELNDSYALMGEANKKLEIFEIDYMKKRINK